MKIFVTLISLVVFLASCGSDSDSDNAATLHDEPVVTTVFAQCSGVINDHEGMKTVKVTVAKENGFIMATTVVSSHFKAPEDSKGQITIDPGARSFNRMGFILTIAREPLTQEQPNRFEGYLTTGAFNGDLIYCTVAEDLAFH